MKTTKHNKPQQTEVEEKDSLREVRKVRSIFGKIAKIAPESTAYLESVLRELENILRKNSNKQR